MKYQVLATDYDGTIAHDGVCDDATVGSLHRAKDAGFRLFLVTGRELNELFVVFPQYRIFERIVAENGAVIFDPMTSDSRTIASPPPPAMLDRLHQLGVPFVAGRSIVATVEPHEHAMLQVIHELELEWHIIFNKGSVMALPSGVNKALGLETLLKELSIAPQQVVAVGDAENDIAFLHASGFPVAVANALPSVKEAAMWTTPSPRGAGVSELIDRLIAEEQQNR